eukprot:1562065-Pleurochrysis_carterae.AAC.1
MRRQKPAGHARATAVVLRNFRRVGAAEAVAREVHAVERVGREAAGGARRRNGESGIDTWCTLDTYSL